MASDKQKVAFIVEQMLGAGEIRSKPMFGEFGIYCDEVFVASVCDNQLFIKASPIANDFLDDTHLAPPYPGAKDAYRVPEHRIQESDWLSAFVRASTAVLPKPKPKVNKRS